MQADGSYVRVLELAGDAELIESNTLDAQQSLLEKHSDKY